MLPGQFIEQRFPVFNPDSIRAHHIQSVSIRLMDKPSNSPMYDHGRRFRYFFDEQGRMVRQQKVYPSRGGRMDTASFHWIYQEEELKATLEQQGRYKRMVRFSQLDEHRVRQTISIKRGGVDWFVLTEEEVETQAFKDGEVIQVGGLNAKPYQSTTTSRNSRGEITLKEVWASGKLQIRESWEFHGGTLDAYVFENRQTNESSVIHFDADLESGTWCHNLDCRDWSIVFHPDGWPKGWIMMNPDSQDMEIWEFQYSHFQNNIHGSNENNTH